MPFPGVSVSASYSTSKTNQDSHDVTTSEANRYDQHYHSSNSGNVDNTSITNTDESDRSTTTTTTMIDRSYHVNIINSNFQSPGMTANLPISQPGAPAAIQAGAANPIGPQLLQIDQFPHPGNEDEKAEAPKFELNLEILYSQMNADMEEAATNFIIVAFIKKSEAMARAKFICDSFEKQFGKSFHCVVGNEFGNFVNYLKKSYIHVKVADQRVILYKTPEITIETEIKKLQDSLEEAKISLEAMETCNTLIEEYRFGMEQACAATKPVAFVGQKHEELQKSAIQKFEEWTKKNEIALTQKHRQDFITLQTNQFFSIYDSRNKERFASENKPDETQWIGASNGDFPHGAVIGSREHGCTMIIARSWHEGHTIPGKLYSSNNACYVCHKGGEHTKNTYEVLCHARVHWERVYRNGSIPAKALPGGHETNVGTLYIGRVQHNGTIVVGKVVPSCRKCYVAYHGKEYGYEEYEILVRN